MTANQQNPYTIPKKLLLSKWGNILNLNPMEELFHSL